MGVDYRTWPISSILPISFLRKEYSSVRQSQEEENVEIVTSRPSRLRWNIVSFLGFLCFLTLFLLASTKIHQRKIAQDVAPGVTLMLNSSQTCSRDFSRHGQKAAVLCLYNRAKTRGFALQKDQSKTIEDATKEYRRRYDRQPPKGFDQCFRYSQKVGAAVIDDYDLIEATLKPFRAMSPEQMQHALHRVTGRKDPLDTFTVRSGEVHFPGNPDDGHIKSMHSVLDPIVKYLPDMQFVLNWDDREAVKGKESKAGIGPDNPKDITLNDHSDAWTFYTFACPNLYLAQSNLMGRPEVNLCENLHNNALVNATGDMQQGEQGISTLVPIMSWSKFSTSRDLLVPHRAFSDPNFRGWNKANDTIPFAEKKRDLCWRGSTTGSSVAREKWRHNHRVRLVQYINDLQFLLKSIVKDPSTASLLSTRLQDNKSTREMLQEGLSPENFNVHLTGLTQCGEDRTGCDALAQSITLVKSEDSLEEFQHQFLLDMDGNSMSGRFYRLLETNGLVFKQTLLGEWHDDRLIPWFHYIPLTFSNLGEIPQLFDFFLNDEEGRRIAQSIAAVGGVHYYISPLSFINIPPYFLFFSLEGRKAAESTLRLEDMSQYWYRLLLEFYNLFPVKEST